MNEKFYALPEEKQSQILNAAYKVFATNQYKKAPTSEIAAEAGISKSLLFHLYKEILYASEGMLKSWYRTGNYDVIVFEQEYLEMINHWEIVYGKSRAIKAIIHYIRYIRGKHFLGLLQAQERGEDDEIMKNSEKIV